jgi:hypothetical protein
MGHVRDFPGGTGADSPQEDDVHEVETSVSETTAPSITVTLYEVYLCSFPSHLLDPAA